jgi:hypothetical protein
MNNDTWGITTNELLNDPEDTTREISTALAIALHCYLTEYEKVMPNAEAKLLLDRLWDTIFPNN